ncbi:cell division protein SepF [Streptococcus sp. zg-JUN1979]|uniref:cell division protein SepF n=1 Tax=Streptococcus sp. zg-JUN1979 TaxID=3391450 RepID=UPI0039A6C371
MAWKNFWDKVATYFDPGDIDDVEDTVEQLPNQQQLSHQETYHSKPSNNRPEKSAQPSQQTTMTNHSTTERYQSQTTSNRQREATFSNQQTGHPSPKALHAANKVTPQLTISLKYPKQYDDAQEIVDLLNNDVCVLIDFQYMLDAQARRCLDFIDGASKVLGGSLQKVGSSIYLLAPAIVSVNLEEALHSIPQEANFDFDMKRR